MSHHVNTAMIMAAGKGTRMMPLTADRPKPLVAVAGTALLDHVLDHLRDAGVGQIVINAHYRASQVEDHMAEHAADFEVSISDERELLLDTGGGLVRALPLIPDDPFIQDSLGWVEFRLGNLTEARRILQAAFERRTDPEIAAHLGVPIGVVRVLVADLVVAGSLEIHATLRSDASRVERRELIERTLSGLRAL